MGEGPDRPERFAVFGYPVKHSLSPAMYNPAFQAMGIQAEYGKVEVHPDDFLEELDRLMEDPCFAGGNLTIPHKKILLDCTSVPLDLDVSVRKVGAANTFMVKAGVIRAWNTDGYGFTEAFRTSFSEDLAGKSLLILGCGGAGLAMAFAGLEQQVSRLGLSNRSQAKADELAADLESSFADAGPVEVIPWEERESRVPDYDVIVNATSLGLKDWSETVVPSGQFRSNQFVFDAVYNPKQTQLMRHAREAGAPGCDGLEMLLYQGVKALSIFTDSEIGRDRIAIMREGIRAGL
ncbi:MAG: shikimate dehydrogenase [Verrucomicrobiota bacterium]